MKKAKIFKIITAILIAITLFLVFSQNSFALNFDISTEFSNTGDKSNTTNSVSGVFGKVINVAQVFGAGFAIIMLLVVAIKWIGAAPSGKAQIAQSATYYILGAIFIFAAIGLLQIVKNFANGSLNKQFQ